MLMMINDIEILYEDDDSLVINKPSGLLVHPSSRSKEETLVDFINSKYPKMKGIGEPLRSSDGLIIQRPGIVHRLDRETSGVMIIAKTKRAYLYFNRQFRDRQVKKEYRAFVYNKLNKKRGTISFPIKTNVKNITKKTAARAGEDGKEAKTDFALISASQKASYVSFFPKTGRTHQIRVHSSKIGHPIICDRRYASGKECILGFSRLALHSYSLTIGLPEKGEKTFIARMPKVFDRALSYL